METETASWAWKTQRQARRQRRTDEAENQRERDGKRWGDVRQDRLTERGHEAMCWGWAKTGGSKEAARWERMDTKQE